MTTDQESTNERVVLALTPEQARLVYEALTDQKNNATKNGAIWPLHSENARCRTLLERGFSRLGEEA